MILSGLPLLVRSICSRLFGEKAHVVLLDLDKIGELKDTLIVITADHGHGFDVFGGVDTKYMQAQTGDLKKREAGAYFSLLHDDNVESNTMSVISSTICWLRC